jgi:hypothetical protein
MFCPKHYQELTKDFNNHVYTKVLQSINKYIRQLRLLRKWDEHDKILYKGLVYTKTYIFLYRRYMNPGLNKILEVILLYWELFLWRLIKDGKLKLDFG